MKIHPKIHSLLMSAALCWGAPMLAAEEAPPPEAAAAPDTAPEAVADETPPVLSEADARIFAALAKLQPQTGVVALAEGMITVHVPEHLRYLDPTSAEVVLKDLWGNPEGAGTLGMLIPADVSPIAAESWGVILTYEDSGHIKDEDAAKIDYADLLEEMKKDTAAANKEREQLGFPAVELVGWATPPRYDSAAKKLYWAKELKFAGSEASTLNYNIRVLGRKGVLNLNVVAAMEQLAQVDQSAPGLLAAVEFNAGHTYADFNPATDNVAQYGIAALIAGGVAAKTGLLKALWLGILAFKKFIIIGVLAVGGWIAKIVSGRKKHPFDEATPPA